MPTVANVSNVTELKQQKLERLLHKSTYMLSNALTITLILTIAKKNDIKENI